MKNGRDQLMSLQKVALVDVKICKYSIKTILAIA